MQHGKLKYVTTILGTVIGLVIAYIGRNFFWALLPVPLGIIGYSVGALLDDEKI
jgi:multisubunit Na+/H+ antiporter MnhE subunit